MGLDSFNKAMDGLNDWASQMKKKKEDDEKFTLTDVLSFIAFVFCIPLTITLLVLLAVVGRILKFAIPAVVITAAVYFTWTWINETGINDTFSSQTQTVVSEESPESNLDVQAEPVLEE